MECYGKLFQKKEECAKCKLGKWCATAGDPELLVDKMMNLSGFSPILEDDLPQQPPETTPEKKDSRTYSQEDLYEVIAFFLALDWQTIEMLEQKLNHPEIKFTEMSRERKITKQAVHKFIKSRCEMFPELEPFLRNRKNRINNNSTKNNETFMEAVCRIKKTTYETQSKRPEPVSPSWKSLNCLTRNLDLSRLSIHKGAVSSN